MALSWTSVINLIRKLIERIILGKIKRVLFGGNFYLGLLKILLQNFFFIWKGCVTYHLFVSFFEVKSQNEPIATKNTRKILLMQLNLLLAMRCKKNRMKSNSKVHFSKQMLLFYLFLPFTLRYVKKCIQFSECYFWMLQFIDRFTYWNHQVYWKKKIYDVNVTLPSQISSRN